jgi:hypothetical protein
MRRRFCISTVALALSVILIPIHISAQQSTEGHSAEKQTSPVPRVEKQDNSAHPKNKYTDSEHIEIQPSPMEILVQGPVHFVEEPTTQEEQEYAQAQSKPWWKRPDWLTVALFGITALFAILAFVASVWQGKSASDMVILTHRPKIIVRNIVIPALASLNRKAPMSQWTQDLTGYYTVANTGGLPCTIQTVCEGNFVGVDLPMERPDRNNQGRQINMVLAPGEAKELPFGHVILGEDDACDLIDGKTSNFFIVRVRYTDNGKVVRETSACRRFNPTSSRFIRVANRDYEYSD